MGKLLLGHKSSAIKASRFLALCFSISFNRVEMFLQSPRVPTRFTVASTFFFTCFISYVLRTNISLIIIELVSSGCVEWSRKDQSFVIGAWYWGYLVTSLIAGFTVRKLSSKDVVGLSLFFSAILTGISPLLVQESIIPFFIARFLLGASGVRIIK